MSTASDRRVAAMRIADEVTHIADEADEQPSPYDVVWTQSRRRAARRRAEECVRRMRPVLEVLVDLLDEVFTAWPKTYTWYGALAQYGRPLEFTRSPREVVHALRKLALDRDHLPKIDPYGWVTLAAGEAHHAYKLFEYADDEAFRDLYR